jgi:hypothetical protein
MIPAPVPSSISPRTLQVSRIQVQDYPDLVRPCGHHPAHSGVGYHDFAVEANRRQACSAASWGRLPPDLAPHDPVVRSIPKIADSPSFLVVCKEQTETLSAAPSEPLLLLLSHHSTALIAAGAWALPTPSRAWSCWIQARDTFLCGVLRNLPSCHSRFLSRRQCENDCPPCPFFSQSSMHLFKVPAKVQS